jgi:thioredoxin reductase (NADPH)
MQDSPERCDVAIIGAGPVGLFAVFECGMLEMRCAVFDALPAPGGQCVALYPEKPIYDIPGYPRIDAAELVERLSEQAAPFAPTYHLGHPVVGLTSTEDGFLIENAAGVGRLARAVMIAAGAGAFGPNRPPLVGIEAFEERSVFYLVRRRDDFRGRRIVIAGGGDSAVDWALSLADIAERVIVVHRRAKFRAAPQSAAQLQRLAEEGRIELVIPYQLHALEGESGKLSAVIVADLAGQTRRLEADCLLPFFCLATDLGPLASWGLEVDHNRIGVDPATCATSRPGIFAIGDIAAYPGKLKLILSGFAEAALAAHAIYPLVHPGQALHFEYSTTKGVPGR